MNGHRPKLMYAMDPALTERILSPAALDRLARHCTILDEQPARSFTDARGRALLCEAEILVSGWGCPPLSADLLDLASDLRLVAHGAGSVRRLIGSEFFDRHILITHAADANAVPVAEFTLATIIYANKKVFQFRDAYRNDRSRHRTDELARQPIGNVDTTVGIIGASRIGRRVISLLAALDLDVLLCDPLIDDDDPVLDGIERVDLDTLVQRSSIISIHAPLLPGTRSMIDARVLSLMPDGATLINTARGAVVDQDALLSELQGGRLNAVLDVTFPEIPAVDSPLYDLPNVVLTPHVAGALGLEHRRLGDLVVSEVERYCRGQELQYGISADHFLHMA